MKMSVYSTAFKNCICGDDLFPTTENLKSFFWKILIIFVTAILTTGLGYLILGVGTNAFSLLFDDTVCTNWIWQTCGSFVEMDIGTSKSVIQFTAGYIVGGLILLIAIGITLIYFTITKRLNWLIVYFGIYIIWAYIFGWISLFSGKQLAVHKFDGCQDYKDYGIILDNLFPHYGFTLCAKIRNIGPNQGAIQDKKLPGDWSTCNKCMNIGFWSIYLSGLILPLLVLGIFLLSRRLKRKIVEAKNIYEPL